MFTKEKNGAYIFRPWVLFGPRYVINDKAKARKVEGICYFYEFLGFPVYFLIYLGNGPPLIVAIAIAAYLGGYWLLIKYMTRHLLPLVRDADARYQARK